MLLFSDPTQTPAQVQMEKVQTKNFTKLESRWIAEPYPTWLYDDTKPIFRKAFVCGGSQVPAGQKYPAMILKNVQFQ